VSRAESISEYLPLRTALARNYLCVDMAVLPVTVSEMVPEEAEKDELPE